MRIKNIIAVCIILSMPLACTQKYNPSIRYPVTGYLVVEGFINSGQGETTIRLSRTLGLNDTANVKTEQSAQLAVEGDDNTSLPLSETGNGYYTNSQLTLNEQGKYRLHIKTADGKEYYSDFMKVIKTPAIDSVSWTYDTTGVRISVNTHDPANNTKYYTWNYEETWEVDASYDPRLKYVKDPGGKIVGVDYIFPSHNPDTSGSRCWHFNNSSTILAASSAKLAQDVIHVPIASIARSSRELSVLYSINVMQHAVSASGYDFLQRLKKNTEETGSIFDPQPAELNTNIHNVADPGEVIIGYIDVADAQQSRLFIRPAEVPYWGYSTNCKDMYEAPADNSDTLEKYSTYTPIDLIQSGGQKSVLIVDPPCANCRLLGGVNVKPSYWPR